MRDVSWRLPRVAVRSSKISFPTGNFVQRPAQHRMFRMTTVTKRLSVSGRVQGVGFRMYMQEKARSLGVIGWVRNRRDGSVEAVVEGTPQAVEAIIAWAHRGPPSAVVTGVKVADESAGSFPEFSQRPTE